MRRLSERLPWLLLALAVVGCYLPWLWHPTAGLSPNIYDLAEWASLYPVARGATPPLLPSFLLRAVFAVLAILAALHAGRTSLRLAQVVLWLAALFLAVTLFPPLEFLTIAREDANYRQQFVLAVAAILGALLTLVTRKFSRNARDVVAAVVALIGIGLGVFGILRAAELFDALGIIVVVGGGAVLFAASLGLLAAENLYAVLRRSVAPALKTTERIRISAPEK